MYDNAAAGGYFEKGRDNMKAFIRCAVVALMLTPALSVAQDFDVGLAAAEAGDFATALREWTPLAEQGNAAAQYNLGQMYRNGYGVAQGHADAQTNLGLMYKNGDGVAQDYAEAVKWYRLAAEQGNAAAQTNLGIMYANGDGVAQDYVTAHMWVNIAAASGAENARENRDTIAGVMTAEAIAEAQQRAKACMESNYNDCD